MTPEEIATQIVRDDRWFGIDYVGDDDLPVPDVDRQGLARDIAAMVLAYGAQCAAAQKERDVLAVTSVANSLPADVDDAFYSGYKLAICNALAAIRAIPPPTQE